MSATPHGKHTNQRDKVAEEMMMDEEGTTTEEEMMTGDTEELTDTEEMIDTEEATIDTDTVTDRGKKGLEMKDLETKDPEMTDRETKDPEMTGDTEILVMVVEIEAETIVVKSVIVTMTEKAIEM
jgi:hypothetical protein